MPQPARQVVDGYAVHQQVASVAVAQRMRPNPLSSSNRAKFLSTFHSCLYAASDGRSMCLDDSALADVLIGQGAAKFAAQFSA